MAAHNGRFSGSTAAKHRRQLAAVGSAVDELRSHDDVGTFIDRSLGVVSTVEATTSAFYDPAFRIGKVVLGVGFGFAKLVFEARLLLRLARVIGRNIVVGSSACDIGLALTILKACLSSPDDGKAVFSFGNLRRASGSGSFLSAASAALALAKSASICSFSGKRSMNTSLVG